MDEAGADFVGLAPEAKPMYLLTKAQFTVNFNYEAWHIVPVYVRTLFNPNFVFCQFLAFEDNGV